MTDDAIYRETILDAALLVADTCGEALADKAGGFTCDEAEAIEALLMAAGNTVWAEEFRRAHVEGDTDDEDKHRDGWTR